MMETRGTMTGYGWRLVAMREGPRHQPRRLEGWAVEVDPQGTLRMSPRNHAMRVRGIPTLCGGILISLICGLLSAGARLGTTPEMIPLMMVFVPLGVILTAEGVWEVFGKVEWRARPNLLEVRKTLFHCRHSSRYTDATLNLVCRVTEPDPTMRQGLSSCYDDALLPDSITRRGGMWFTLSVEERGRRHCLWSFSRTRRLREDARAISELVSERTGWPLILQRQHKRYQRWW
jgi:hypothetical protein